MRKRARFGSLLGIACVCLLASPFHRTAFIEALAADL